MVLAGVVKEARDRYEKGEVHTAKVSMYIHTYTHRQTDRQTERRRVWV
jgi:hypothetical protein